MLELRAVADGRAAGVVLESSLEKGRGAVSTILVTRGKLRLGDALLAGQEYGRVRAMTNELGVSVTEAGPSQPVAVLGLSGTPNAGDDALVLEDERKARDLAQFRLSRTRDVKLAQQQSAKLEDVFSQLEASQIKTLPILIKADVQGSAEALKDAMNKLAHEEVNVKVIGASVGAVTASDVTLAAASKAIIIAFNVRADGAGRDAIKETGVDVRYYGVIYEALDDVKRAITGMLSPIVRDQIVGLAEVRDVFRSPKFGNIAGCLVIDGYVKRNNPIRVLRNNTVIYEGELESLRRFKDDVSEVRAGTECGIGVRNYDDVKPGDQIECYERVTIDRTCLSRPACRASPMAREFARSRRVEEQIQRLLSDVMRSQLRDPRVAGRRDHRSACIPRPGRGLDPLLPDWYRVEALRGDSGRRAGRSGPGGGLPPEPAGPGAVHAHRAGTALPL